MELLQMNPVMIWMNTPYAVENKDGIISNVIQNK